MPVMTGRLTDAGEAPMSARNARMFWHLNRGTIHGAQIIVNHAAEAVISGDRFSVNVAQTGLDEFYRVEVEYYDDHGERLETREIATNVEVPEHGGELGGETGGWITPDTVWIGLEEADPHTNFWLQATVGDPDPGTSTGTGDLYIWRD